MVPPSPLETEPPQKSFGRVRISAWAGFAGASIRKDTKTLEGDRLSWEDDLGGSPFFIAPVLRADVKIRPQVFGFLAWAYIHRQSRHAAPPGGVRFDGTVFSGGSDLTVSVSRLLADLGVYAWGTVEKTYRIGFVLGARYESLEHVLDLTGGPRARETTESVFPFVEARGECVLAPAFHLEGFARASLFTISYREIIEQTDTVEVLRDRWGNPVGERVSSERKRYLLTQVNGLLEIGAGIRFDVFPGSSLYGGFRFTFHNAERIGDGRREDMEWRALALEVGWEARF